MPCLFSADFSRHFTFDYVIFTPLIFYFAAAAITLMPRVCRAAPFIIAVLLLYATIRQLRCRHYAARLYMLRRYAIFAAPLRHAFH